MSSPWWLSREHAGAGLREPPERQQQSYQALLDEGRVLGGGIGHPLSRPLAALGLQAEGRRQRFEAQEEIVGGQPLRAQARDDRPAHRRVPHPRQGLEERRVARRLGLLSQVLHHRGHERVNGRLAVLVHARQAGQERIASGLLHALQQLHELPHRYGRQTREALEEGGVARHD